MTLSAPSYALMEATPPRSTPSAPSTCDPHWLYGVPDGAQPLALRHIRSRSPEARSCIFVTHHDRHLQRFIETAPFFLPEDVTLIAFPAWDCLPYDRSAPSRSILAQRVAALIAMQSCHRRGEGCVVVTTVNAVTQKLPPREVFHGQGHTLTLGDKVDQQALVQAISAQGYRRASKVMEPGEFAVRGSLIDLYPGDAALPVRIDLFDDTIESITHFDPLSQRSGEEVEAIPLTPTSELLLNEARIARFRRAYRSLFGLPPQQDTLYHGVSQGQHVPGMEHWLPLFYERTDTLLDYLPDAPLCLDHEVEAAIHERDALIHDYYQARQAASPSRSGASSGSGRTGAVYQPLQPDALYLSPHAWQQRRACRLTWQCSAWDAPGPKAAQLGLKPVSPLHRAAAAQARKPLTLLEREVAAATAPVALACYSDGSAARLSKQLAAHGLPAPAPVSQWDQLRQSRPGLYITTLPLTRGLCSPEATLYSEEDLLGQRVVRTRKQRRASEAFMAEASAFEPGELLVHRDHGIASFAGLETLEIQQRRHDCLKLLYHGDDRLFVPVENLDVLSRHGGQEGDVERDKLGAGHWQARKAALKEKLRLSAEQLLQTAAAREISTAHPLSPMTEMYQDFVARFPYEETEDQQRAIEEVIHDLQQSRPMDRLLCGDVGFGKTEVSLRAAFIAATDAVAPRQVAFIAPTTLLVRQHYHTFRERFAETGLEVAQLSRLCSAKEAARVRQGLAAGTIDIVIGTHALLAKSVAFARLGLMIVDEEQRFGVAQKEKLKNLKADLHVLSMSATPIPRTLQLSLTGVRDLSLITTPPVDRLAVRSFVMPVDPVVLKEAIQREMHRGGQVFYVTPRVADLPELQARVRELAPKARLGLAHGQMSARELDQVMNDVYDGRYDILLSTAIIESGINLPNANTLIVNRADRFGLAQLYQLRGRVGRDKVRAYAYFTLPYHGAMSAQAMRRLEVMQSLDTLGAGFTLASHDMDIRGFGNIVGEEQSGRVKDIGVELYQQMLADAVQKARSEASQTATEALPAALAGTTREAGDDWSPQLNLGLSVQIPESYVEDLSLRLSLYRRAATLASEAEIESFAAELTDRFGPLPVEVEHLCTSLKLKHACKQAGIARIDTGPKGAVVHFKPKAITNPEALLAYIGKQAGTMKMRADQSLFYAASWEDDRAKIQSLELLIHAIAAL